MSTWLSKNSIKKIREVEKDLPHFIPEYFIGVEHNTSALTRLNYAYDLRIFFYYLVNYVATFQDVGSPQNFTIDDLKKVTTTHLERYTDFLTYYEYNGKTYYQLDAEDVTPSGKTQLRWLQQAINAVWSAGPTPAATEPPQPEPQQQAAPPAPRAAAPAQPAQQPESTQPARQYTEDEMRIIEGDDDDLPF